MSGTTPSSLKKLAAVRRGLKKIPNPILTLPLVLARSPSWGSATLRRSKYPAGQQPFEFAAQTRGAPPKNSSSSSECTTACSTRSEPWLPSASLSRAVRKWSRCTMARRSETSLLALALGRFGAAPSQDDPFVVVLTSDKAELEQVSEVCVCICLRTGARLCWLTPAGGVVPT